MIQIKSFEDMEIKIGVFPLEVYFHLESTISRTTNYLSGLSIDDINETLTFVRHLMRQMRNASQDPMVTNIWKDILVPHLSSPNRFAPPDKEKTVDQLFVQFLDKSFFYDQQYLRHDIRGNKTVEGVLAMYKRVYASMSLYYFELGKKVAYRIQRNQHENNSEYYRLGKASPYFMASDYILYMLDRMNTEVIAIRLKESQLEEKRKESASQGGKTKNTRFSQLKKKCIKIYDNKFVTRSNRDAASHIYDLLDDEDKLIFRGDNPKHQITVWIGQYKNGKLIID